MKNFFESRHCRSLAHCTTCRDLQGGRAWRRSVIMADPAIQEIDFACPLGATWVVVPRPDPEAEYEAVSAYIQSMSVAEDTAGLKEELRLVEQFLSLHTNQTPCWKARQKARLVQFVKHSRLAAPRDAGG
jgi:hypothetical protein